MSWANKMHKKIQTQRQIEALAKQVKNELMKDDVLNKKISEYDQNIRKDIEDKNAAVCAETFYSACAVVLHRNYKFGKKRILNLFKEIDDLLGSGEDMTQLCDEEVGITVKVQ